MRTFGMIIAAFFGVLLLGGMGGCSYLVSTYNKFPTHDEIVKKSWAEVEATYKRRADLVQNMANVAEKYMTEEQKTIIEHARARAGGAAKLPDNPTPEQIKAYNEAQASMKAASVQLNAIRESVPNLKADIQFLTLQNELKNTENMIRARRDRYIREVGVYNVLVRRFPGNMVASWGGFKEKPQLTFEDSEQIRNAPVLFKK